CATVSLKTTLLAAVLAMTLGFTMLVCGRRLGLAGIGRILGKAWPMLLGMAIAPAILASYFMMKGAWEPFLYGTIQHNLLPDVDAKNHPSHLRLAFPVALPFLLVMAGWIAHRTPATPRALRRAGLFLLAGLYFTALYSFWTLLTRQDFLPFYPIAIVLLAAVLIALTDRFLASRATCALFAVGVLEIVLLIVGRKPWIDGTQREREILREVLKLTQP